MNTQHLQYVVEIERMRSISQAAENLFIGQPNLSRILHDMEDTLGFKIFERTSRGVRPTERGTIFLQHAKSILREMDSIEALGPRRPVANRLRICIPRSAAMLDLTSEFIATLPEDQNLDVAIRECHARKALELLATVKMGDNIYDKDKKKALTLVPITDDTAAKTLTFPNAYLQPGLSYTPGDGDPHEAQLVYLCKPIEGKGIPWQYGSGE